MFGLSYIKFDLSRRSIRRTGRDMGLALRDGDRVGRPVHLWPVSSGRAAKDGRVRGVTPWDIAELWTGLCFSSYPPPAPISLSLSPSPPAQGVTPGVRSTACGLVSTTSACCLSHHQCSKPLQPQAVMHFRGLCYCMGAQILEAVKSLIPGGCQELKSLWEC